ncbi:hypothetical protein CSHISOI_06865, partial [Colletotrichum shisoi]
GGGLCHRAPFSSPTPTLHPSAPFWARPDCRLRPIGTLQRSKQQVPKDSRPLPRSDVVRPYETSRCGHRDPESRGGQPRMTSLLDSSSVAFGLCVGVGVGGGSSPDDAGRRRTGCLPLFPAAAAAAAAASASASARDTR